MFYRVMRRHCAKSWKVSGAIPNWVTEVFRWLNLCGRTIALGLTQLLTELSTKLISCGVKAAGS